MADSKGFVKLETQTIQQVVSELKNGISTYNSIKERVSKTTSELLSHWDGKGRDQFEKDYNVIYRQLDDIEDLMYDLYNELIEVEAAYIEADQSISKNVIRG